MLIIIKYGVTSHGTGWGRDAFANTEYYYGKNQKRKKVLDEIK